MTTKPTSNAPAQMQKWTRWVDKQLDELGDGAIPKIINQLARMDANDIRYQEKIATLQYQLKYLTNLIGSSADFSTLQSSINGGSGIANVNPPANQDTSVEKTIIFTASGSASWAGSNLITGSGTYTDAGMMYQGPAAGTQKTASFWFSSTDLAKVSGKTISSVSIYVKNRHFYYNAGGTADFRSHGLQSSVRPTTLNTANPFSATFSYGEGKYIDLGLPAYNSIRTAVYNGISGGTIKGFSIGINATDDPGDYSYFDGATKTYPPKLKITYTA